MNKRQLKREIALQDAHLAANITHLRARRKVAAGAASPARLASLPLLLGGSLAGGFVLGLASRKCRPRHLWRALRWGMALYRDC